ncbi:hypothetical protein [Helicobacter cholecystus]|uniref:hypothetical protein n=1 Tax=Helicobacter cholecystus TaxID=45498 RepID=UPI00273A3BC4|nr:hypothetical protein [Helicobacter cholecystus]
MVHNNKLISLFLFSSLAWGTPFSNWKDPLFVNGINQNLEGSFTYDQTQIADFVLTDKILFTRSMFNLSVRSIITGDWSGQNEGFIFYANNAKRLTFNKGNISFFINSEGLKFGKSAYFQISDTATLDINANLTIISSAKSVFDTFGLFGLKNNARLNIEDANLNIDLSNNQKANPLLFLLENSSEAKINSGGNKANQTIFLKGKIDLRGASKFELNLSNRYSYYEGAISIAGTSELSINLSNSLATFTNYSQQAGSATISLENNSTLNAMISGHQTDLIINRGSVWNMLEQNNGTGGVINFTNNIKNLAINNAKINFMNNTDGTHRFNQTFNQKTLNARGALSGNGIFAIYADVGDQTKGVDTITFQSAQGHHTFDILYNPNTFTQTLAEGISTADNMIVATINDPNTQVTFSTLPTTMGLTSYSTYLQKQTDATKAQWLIAHITPDGESPLSQALTTALNTPYRLFKSSSQTLNLRLGDLRNYPKDYGLYLHTSIAYNSFAQNRNLTAGQDLFINIVGGYDMNALYRGHNDFLGFGFEINFLDTTTDIFTSNTQSYGGFFYYTSIWSNRFYYDVIFKYAYSPTDINLGSMASSTSLSSHLLNLTAEVGKKFAFNSNRNFAYTEIEGKLTSGFIFPASLSTSDPNGTPIEAKINFQFPLLLRSSIYFGYEWNKEFKGDLKAGVFIDYSLFSGAETTLLDRWSEFKKTFDMDFDIGVSIISNITLKDYLRFYLELDSSFMGSYQTNILFNAGIRWSFGERYIPPPPPPADPDRLKIRKIRGNTIRDIPTVEKNDRSNMKHYEGSRNQIINTYKNSDPIIQQEQNNEENRNTNRFYPRDNTTLYPSTNTQERPKREGNRDFYNPSRSEEEAQKQRYYHQDRYTPIYPSK